MREITAVELKAWQAREEVYILDVREPFELNIASLEGVKHIPLGQLSERADEIPRDRRVVCLCHHGVRSAYACRELAAKGFRNTVNLVGGIDAWSRTVDPSVALY